MIDPAVLYRNSLFAFTREVFRQLHPGHPPLERAWYMRAMCHALEQTFRGHTRRLVINVPPRYGKSITASVAFTAWLLGHDPTLKILVGTYGEELSRQQDQQLKQIMASPQYRAAFPRTVIDRLKTRQLDLHTTAGGFRKAVTTGGAATGFGGDYILLDDCMKAQDATSEAERLRVHEWYRGTIGTRLNDKRDGRIISIQQRLHQDDLTALILAGGAEHLNLPAIAQQIERIPIGPGLLHTRDAGDVLDPTREDLATLERIRRELGPRTFAPQYLQDVSAAEGNIVRPHWFPRYDDAPARERFLKIIQSWDTAMNAEPTSAYSVCTTWGYLSGHWYLLDVLRKRLEYPDLKREVVGMWRHWRADAVLIEDAASGIPLWAEFRMEGPFRPVMWSVAGSKEERLIGQTGQMEAGKIMLPSEAPWLSDYLHELKTAPNCRYWDQIDSTTQFLEFALSRKGWIETETDPISGRPLRIKRPSRIQRSG